MIKGLCQKIVMVGSAINPVIPHKIQTAQNIDYINVSLRSRIRAPALSFTSLHIGAEMILKAGGTMNN